MIISILQLVGPMTDNLYAYFGNYSPDVAVRYSKTPLQTLQSLGHTHSYAAGCTDGTNCKGYDPQSIKTAVSGASVVVVCLGTGRRCYGHFAI